MDSILLYSLWFNAASITSVIEFSTTQKLFYNTTTTCVQPGPDFTFKYKMYEVQHKNIGIGTFIKSDLFN